jgi:hypothetical protein
MVKAGRMRSGILLRSREGQWGSGKALRDGVCSIAAADRGHIQVKYRHEYGAEDDRRR